MNDLDFVAGLAQANESKLVLLVLDGIGDLRTAEQPRTALEVANVPAMDELAKGSSLGRMIPVRQGVTPGSGPGHLGLFGYDPTLPEVDIGRGVLEALGLGLDIPRGTVAARGNFATADGEGNLTDRRAGRIPTSECQRLCTALQSQITEIDGTRVEIIPGEGHRFVLLLHGEDLSPELMDTDPQRLGVPPLEPTSADDRAGRTVAIARELIDAMNRVLSDESQANRALLRGFSSMPQLRPMPELYRMRCGAFAGYPLYRGVASACGMEVVPCSKDFGELVGTVADRWQDFDFFFLHVKKTDAAGEDGDLEAKARALETVDAELQRIVDLQPNVIAITGDHSTPAPMKAHSWHPIPLLLHSKLSFIDEADAFDEVQAIRGHLGTFPSKDLIALMLAHAGRLAKFGA